MQREFKVGLRKNLRVVGLERASRASVVGDGSPSLGLEEGILGGRLVNHVGEPGVPARVDLGTAECVSFVRTST